MVIFPILKDYFLYAKRFVRKSSAPAKCTKETNYLNEKSCWSRLAIIFYRIFCMHRLPVFNKYVKEVRDRDIYVNHL